MIRYRLVCHSPFCHWYDGSSSRACCQFLKQKLLDGTKKYLSTYPVKRIRNSDLYLTAMNQIFHTKS